jgi:hypothetical protein
MYNLVQATGWGSPSQRATQSRLITSLRRPPALRSYSLESESVSDPWEGPFRPTIEEASAIRDWPARVAAFKEIAAQIGKPNEDMIRSCDAVLGVLDGAELDSGTVSEIGFGAGVGKRCYGLRTDFRECGDFDGIPINLQVLYWIESGGGRLFRKIEETLWADSIARINPERNAPGKP